MNINKVLIILGEPYSVFSEILFKYIKSKEYKKNKKIIILIGNLSLLNKQMRKLNYKILYNKISDVKQAKKNKINIINIDFKYSSIFGKITKSSSDYISECFNYSLNILKRNKNIALINGPISKKHYFIKKRFPGVTEFLAKNTKTKNEIMLIYNKKLSVSPITTHIPIKLVNKKIKKEKIINNVISLNKFYKNNLKNLLFLV